jgi:hypothetical protein
MESQGCCNLGPLGGRKPPWNNKGKREAEETLGVQMICSAEAWQTRAVRRIRERDRKRKETKTSGSSFGSNTHAFEGQKSAVTSIRETGEHDC